MRQQYNPLIITVTTDGRTGDQFITHMAGRATTTICHDARQLLRSSQFIPSNGITYNLAIIMGDEFQPSQRTNRHIETVATELGYLKPPMTVAPLLREKLSDDVLKIMNLRALVVMHPPIICDGSPSFLGIRRSRRQGHLLCAYHCGLNFRWYDNYGFAYLVLQESSG